MVDFGSTLKRLRQEAGFTQQQLAERLGVTKSVISYYELSERAPSPEILVKLASVFHVTTDFLLGIDRTEKVLDLSGLDDDDIMALQHMATALRKKS